MKYFLFLLLTLPAFADVKVCDQFVDTVLKPAVTLDEKAEDHGNRFVKDEGKALEFIRSYDVSKLQIPEELKLAELQMNDCKVLMNPKTNDKYCGALFVNYSYLRGLLYGTKNYKWKPSTVELAKKNVDEFLKETTLPGIPLIYLAFSYALLEEMNPSEKVKADRVELEAAIQKIQADAKKNPAVKCPDIQNYMKIERNVAEKFRVKLADLIKEKK